MKNILFALCSVIIVVGVIGAIFFWKYKGTAISYSYLYFWGNFVIIGLGAFGLKMIDNSEFAEVVKHKTNYIEFDIDLSKIEVLDNRYFIENEKYHYSKTPLMDFIVEGRNPKQYKEINQCRFEYTVMYKGDTLTFVSPIINKDRETLMFKLFAQKQTKLHLDKDDYSNHYLDLDFLKE